MSNIFYSSTNLTGSLPSTATFTSLETGGLVLTGASHGDVLFIGVSSQVEGLTIGPNNYVLVSNGTEPAWSNTLVLNEVQTTELKIDGIQNGDIIIGQSDTSFARLPIGALGNVLTVNSFGVPQWQNIDIPDPLILNDLQLDISLKLPYLANGQIFISGGTIYSEAPKIQNFAGVKVFGSAGNIDTFFFSSIAGRKYKISVNFVLTTYNGAVSTVSLRKNGVIKKIIIDDSNNPRPIQFEHVFTETVSANHSYEIYGFTNTAPTNDGELQLIDWSIQPLGI